MEVKVQEHDFKIDFIRGLSMMMIVIYHYSCALEIKEIENAYRPFWHFASGAWGSVFVVVFFMISGYVMILQYNERCEVLYFYKKRWLSIFPMFYLVYVVMYLIRTIQYKTPLWGGSPLLIVESLLGMDGYLKNGKENYYTVGEWFLGAIILIYVLFPLLRSLFKKYEVMVNILFVSIFAILECTDYIIYFSRTNLFFCVFSFWMGMVFWKYKEQLKNYGIVLGALIICVTFYYIDVTVYFSEIAVVHVMGIAVFIILYSLPSNILGKKQIGRSTILFFSRYSYSVMLVHHVLIYWMIKACQILKMNLNVSLVFIILVIYLVAWGVKSVSGSINKKVVCFINKRF